MDIASKMNIKLTVSDTTELIRQAISNQLFDQFGMEVPPQHIKVTFNTTMDYGEFDSQFGTPVLSGVTIETEQNPPVKRSTSTNSLASQIADVESMGQWQGR